MAPRWLKRIKDMISSLDEDYEQMESASPPQRWNELFDRIAREIERVMRMEMFQPPGEPIYIPSEYLVFMSMADHDRLQGAKRQGFVRGLGNRAAESARQLAGTARLHTDRFWVELRVDSGLAEGQFYVKPSWDVEPEPTVVQLAPPRQQRTPPAAESDDELTTIRRQPRFYIEVQRHGVPQPTVYPVYQAEARVGRGSKDIPVDVPLPEDREISRLHMIVKQTPRGYEVTMKGQNPISIAGIELERDQTRSLQPNEPVHVGIYTICIKTDLVASARQRDGDESSGTRSEPRLGIESERNV